MPAEDAANDIDISQQTLELPKPGQLLHLDFRHAGGSQEGSASHAAAAAHPLSSGTIRLVQWNIERGYKLAAVIAELAACNADIIALQEVDIGCDRSGGEDTGRRIAEALHMNYVFLCEFEELRSPLRDAASQGGGVHGNAILSRFDMSDARVIRHRGHPVDWEAAAHPLAKREPRRGRRAALAATLHTPAGPVLVYNLHLEVFCGMLARVSQFADVMRDSREQLWQGVFRQAVLADLNTMAHGVARLSPHYCCDRQRFRTLGQTEAEWWDRTVLAVRDPSYQPATDAGRPADTPDPEPNPWLLQLGLRRDVCQDVLNPGFADPFDVRRDVTLDNPKYRLLGWPLMAGKLDWVLLRRLAVRHKEMRNLDYAASDHRLLLVDATLD